MCSGGGRLGPEPGRSRLHGPTVRIRVKNVLRSCSCAYSLSVSRLDQYLDISGTFLNSVNTILRCKSSNKTLADLYHSREAYVHDIIVRQRKLS